MALKGEERQSFHEGERDKNKEGSLTFLLGERKLRLTDVTVFLGLVCCSALSSFPLAGVAACFPWLLFSYLVLVVSKRGHFRFLRFTW